MTQHYSVKIIIETRTELTSTHEAITQTINPVFLYGDKKDAIKAAQIALEQLLKEIE